MSIKATSKPESGFRGYAGRDRIADISSFPWPGVPATHPRDWCNDCTRAWHHGRYQVKHLNAMCGMHRRWRG